MSEQQEHLGGHIDRVVGPTDPERVEDRVNDLWARAREANSTIPRHDAEHGIFHDRLFLHQGDSATRTLMLVDHYEFDEHRQLAKSNRSIFVLDPQLAVYLYPHGTDQIVFRLREGIYGTSVHEYRDTGSAGLQTVESALPDDRLAAERLADVLEHSDFEPPRQVLSTAA